MAEKLKDQAVVSKRHPIKNKDKEIIITLHYTYTK